MIDMDNDYLGEILYTNMIDLFEKTSVVRRKKYKRCDGSGKVMPRMEGDDWSFLAALVKPIECEDCDGTGFARFDPWARLTVKEKALWMEQASRLNTFINALELKIANQAESIENLQQDDE